ncbi:MAG: Zn-ribbon domain-containing OB-fold protein [Metallosphaera sp.]
MEGIPLELRYTLSERGYEKFWEGLTRSEIWTTRCQRCGTIYYPPQLDCTVCMNSRLDWIKLSNEGKLMTYTVVKAKPQGFENEQDYVIGIVRTKEGVDLMCWIKGIPKIGASVVLSSDGRRVIGEVHDL